MGNCEAPYEEAYYLDINREIQIEGCVDVKDNPISADEFCDKFIEWIESNGWYFGGGIKPYAEE